MKIFLYKQWVCDFPARTPEGTIGPNHLPVNSCGTCKNFDGKEVNCGSYPTLKIEIEWVKELDYDTGCPAYKRNEYHKRLA